MPKIQKINHIALVVEDITTALMFWQDALGIKVEKITQVPQEDSAVAFLPIGDTEIELVQPTSYDSGVAKYLAKRGPGMHHLCLQVQDIQKVMDHLVEKGIKMIRDTPVLAEDGRKYAFIHPKAAFGVLVELYQLPTDSPSRFPVLETSRLIMREFQETDIQAVFDIFSRPDFNQFLETDPMQSLADAETRVQNRINLFKRGFGCRWAIAFKEIPHQVIGSCGYFHVRISTQTFEMGYEVHPDYWRRGIMTEAMTAILDYSFSEHAFFPVNRLEALVDPRNAPSLGLLHSLGFASEGTRRQFGYWKGSYQDVELMALLKEEWQH